MSAKKEFGDFQTTDGLAHKVTVLEADIFGTPAGSSFLIRQANWFVMLEN